MSQWLIGFAFVPIICWLIYLATVEFSNRGLLISAAITMILVTGITIHVAGIECEENYMDIDSMDCKELGETLLTAEKISDSTKFTCHFYTNEELIKQYLVRCGATKDLQYMILGAN